MIDLSLSLSLSLCVCVYLFREDLDVGEGGNPFVSLSGTLNEDMKVSEASNEREGEGDQYRERNTVQYRHDGA